ncbi:MAG TPA: VOC family protein [Thermomicrobiales bacterium]|jgi:predicted enzyme related to lactoylglutathione lyase|nr:VOC family protein [Thermomicrobiales bacterium]
MALTRIHNAEILVSDQDRALAFYTDLLGWEKRDDNSFGPDYRWLTVGAPGDPVSIALSRPQPDGGTPGGPTGISIQSDNIDADYARLSAAGVHFTQPPTEEPWGDKATWFDDPDGNRFYLIQVASS